MKQKTIKNTFIACTLLASTQIFSFEASPRKEILRDIKIQTKKCVVQIVERNLEAQNENVVGYKSLCGTFQISSPSEAHVFFEGEWLTASITESAESDGGDLDDLTITNSKGQIQVTKTNIAAYDSILVAMAGDSDFKKVYLK
jgi:hypothetical protein